MAVKDIRKFELGAIVILKSLCLGWMVVALFCVSAFAEQPFVVAVISPLTGPMATVGAQSTAGLRLWAQTVNAGGGVKGRAGKTVRRGRDFRGLGVLVCNTARGHRDSELT